MKRAMISLLVVLLASGCLQDEATFVLEDVAENAPSCLLEVFPFQPRFMTVRDEGSDSIGFYFQSHGGTSKDADLLYIFIKHPQNVVIGTPIPLSAPADRVGHAKVEAGHSCTDIFESFVIEGLVEFENFSNVGGDRMVGSLRGELLDSRTRFRVGVLEGSFDFEVRRGQPWEHFRSHSP